jgi:SAM-dependent methyltransferase
MHDTALMAGDAMAHIYGKPGLIVLDIGGRDINGSLRKSFESRGMKYICVDMVEHPSVDIVVGPGEPFPFEDGSIDVIVSTSCFEHDPCFWLTFREMARVVKEGGYIYVNAPSNGPYHGYPGDNWRFYGDAGQALAHWSGRTFEGKSYPTQVEESFHVLPEKGGLWQDFVCVWKRILIPVDKIVDREIRLAKTPIGSYLQLEKHQAIMKMN